MPRRVGVAGRFPRHDKEADPSNPRKKRNVKERVISMENTSVRLHENNEYLDLLPPNALREAEYMLSALMVHSRQAHNLIFFLNI